MVKPGVNWDPTKPKEPEIKQPKPKLAAESMSGLTVAGEGGSAARKQRHSRTPSIVLSPSPSLDVPGAPQEKDILLTLDSAAELPPKVPVETLSTFHDTAAKPEFWQKLLVFLRLVCTDIHFPWFVLISMLVDKSLQQNAMRYRPGRSF